MSRPIVLTVFSTALLASALSAQSFNLDVGDNLILYPLPSPAHGAEASQPGTWNNVKTPYSVSLVRLDGTASPVSTSSNYTSSYNYPFTGLSGDDLALMADIQTISPIDGTKDWFFTGLQDGAYRLFTYAWSPSSPNGRTSVDVVGSTDAAQVVGGAWAGGPHVLGTTYALHHVQVSGGTMHVLVTGANGTAASVNGYQIVFDGPTCACSSTFCIGDGVSAACPCGNNGSAGRGCNNSAATGGAQLLASGTVSPDTVVLQVTGTLPTAPGIFLQGTSQLAAPGVTFGDGARCIGGTLKRLAVKIASGGASSFPQGGDPSITAKSASLGDPIAPGSTRYYQTYYRDPDLGFCNPAPSTFNVSSAISILW